jgi:hypothetical protein
VAPRAGPRARGARQPRAAPPRLLGASLLIARKDLAIEFRTRTAFFSSLVFALLATVIFYFAGTRPRCPLPTSRPASSG